MDQTVIENSERIKVLSQSGYVDFDAITKTWHDKVVKLITHSHEIVCGLKHKFLISGEWVEAKNITEEMPLTTVDNLQDPILHVDIIDEPQWLYDLVNVANGNSYIAEGVVSHNCEFISSEAMLIDSLKLSYLKAAQPIHEDMGYRFWKKEENIGGDGKVYFVGVDPATGNGSDFTVVQVIEYPSMEQVAELRLNTVNIPLIFAKIKWMLKLLSRKTNKGQAEVLWSFERNGVGEALVAMIQNDDSEDGGVYMDNVELVNENPVRLGCYTTGSSKFLACMKMKSLIERGKDGITLHSDNILTELQSFVSIGNTYKAKPGATDDAIMALAVVMKIMQRFATYDDGIRKIIYEQVDADSDQEPLIEDSFCGEPAPMAF